MRARSATSRSLTTRATRAERAGEPAGQAFCLVARAMTSANCSSVPSCDQVRCSQSWQELNCTGGPSVSVIDSAVTRALPHDGQVPDGWVPAWVSEAAAVELRWVGIAVMV